MELNEMNLSDTTFAKPDEGMLRALGYIATLLPEGVSQCIAAWGLDANTSVLAVAIDTPAACLDCLGTLQSYGISTSHLFDRGDVWFTFISSIADPKYHTALSFVMGQGTPADLINYLNISYKFGHSVIPDQEYDALEKLYLAAYPGMPEIVNKVSEDAEMSFVVREAMKFTATKSSRAEGTKVQLDAGVAASLNAEKSTSVRPVRSYEETFEYVTSQPASDADFSLKVDGINTKGVVSPGVLEVALSRGRASDSWDYTEALRRVITLRGVDISSLQGKVTGESIVDVSALPLLKAKYPDKDYKSPKSTAGAMLRAPHHFDVEDYKYLRFFPFEYAEYSKDEAFNILSAAGFEVPPHIHVKASEIPRDSLERFSAWLDKILDKLWEDGCAQGIGSDGVVLQLLGLQESDRADKYSDSNIALKFSHWTEAEYESEVIGIEFEQRRVEISIVLLIAPVTTRDLNVATRVSVGSPAILVQDGVRVGDRIRFTRKSEANNVYLEKVM